MEACKILGTFKTERQAMSNNSSGAGAAVGLFAGVGTLYLISVVAAWFFLGVILTSVGLIILVAVIVIGVIVYIYRVATGGIEYLTLPVAVAAGYAVGYILGLMLQGFLGQSMSTTLGEYSGGTFMWILGVVVLLLGLVMFLAFPITLIAFGVAAYTDNPTAVAIFLFIFWVLAVMIAMAVSVAQGYHDIHLDQVSGFNDFWDQLFWFMNLNKVN